MMKKLTLLAVTTLLTLALSLSAQPGPGAPGPGQGMQGPGGCMKALNLDDAQQKALMESRNDHRKTMIPMQADMKVARMELQELIAKGEDRKKIDKQQDAINDLHAKIAKAKNDHLLKVREIVGEDNFMKMHAGMGHGMKKGRGMGGCMGGDCGPCDGQPGPKHGKKGFFRR